MLVEQKNFAALKDIPALAAGVIVFNNTNDVLLVRHKDPPHNSIGVKQGLYGLPAGIKEKGMTLRMTALKELEEEAGIITIPEFLSEFPGNDPEPALVPRSNDTGRLLAHRSYLYTGSRRFSPFIDNPEVIPGWHTFRNIIKFRDQQLLLPNVYLTEIGMQNQVGRV
jgi:8-oxo-dGTP pyrophosphatase MutT (NUDIX family)